MMSQEDYKPIVRIKDVEDFRKEGNGETRGDRRDGLLYQYTPEIKLAVNVALATNRPLLMLGGSGCGKSCLAFNLARIMKRGYYEFVVSSRSQARDLLYRFDAVRRLGDSHMARTGGGDTGESSPHSDRFPYVEPGPLWWCIDPESARRRGYPGEDVLPFTEATDPATWSAPGNEGAGAVLLVDEIDKAEPDFANNLLVPFGSWQFHVDEVSTLINLSGKGVKKTRHPLMIITSNRERELPLTFLRRCVVLELPAPTQEQLVALAAITFPEGNEALFKNVAAKLVEQRVKEGLSTAEYLDAVKAIMRLEASDSTTSDILMRTSWRPS